MGRKRGTNDAAAEARADKTCASCGRRIEWRAAWARDWEAVRYCSDACRARKVRPVDRTLEESIRSLLAQRAHDATICPSEAARAVAAAEGASGGAEDEAWRALMEPARRAARRLVAAGEVEITQGGRVVDPSTAKGPIRVRRAR
ncbi:DUF3253 domain-containing protein [Microcella daejeonensis]|uniref:DUF3253 domain-containing protein n=1 Tax=Microcella daejeonensis TaxID=2994971 RepID=UPI00226D7D36|nr:DUF3253 domain-containing protein [Microcella daejeonensis]WAB84391.1 DUF3253 domain-containing protein [Microcella daejeonensis]